MRALRKIYKVTLGRKFPYVDQLWRKYSSWGPYRCICTNSNNLEFEEKVFRTRGLDADQTEAAIKATMKMLNIIENEYE